MLPEVDQVKRQAFKMSGRSRREQDNHWYKNISSEVQLLIRHDHKDHLDEITAKLTMISKRLLNWIKCFSRDTAILPQLQTCSQALCFLPLTFGIQ